MLLSIAPSLTSSATYLHQPLRLLDNPTGQSRHGESFEGEVRSVAWHRRLKSAARCQEGHGAGGGLGLQKAAQVMTVGVLGAKLLERRSPRRGLGSELLLCERRGISRLSMRQYPRPSIHVGSIRRRDQKTCKS